MGRASSRQTSLGQVGRRAAQHLILLLQQPAPLARLTQLGALRLARPGPGAVIDIGLTQLLEQRHRMDPEVTGDLLNRDTGLPVTGWVGLKPATDG